MLVNIIFGWINILNSLFGLILSATMSCKFIKFSAVDSYLCFHQVLHFNYEHFRGNISKPTNVLQGPDFRAKDWGPAPRWVAFVDFFLASRAKHAVVSGAHRRVGTTYAQLIAALAAANSLSTSYAQNSVSRFSRYLYNFFIKIKISANSQ